MSARRAFDYTLFVLTVFSVTVVGLEELLGLLGRHSYALWTANFILLTANVLACIPLAVYNLYLSWQVARSYLV